MTDNSSNRAALRLLRKTDEGTKYATETISIALDYAKGSGIRQILSKYNKEHEALKGKLIAKIHEMGASEDDHPTFSAKMAKMHMKVSLELSPSEHRIAEIMVNGCHMGIKTLWKEKNRSKEKGDDSQMLADWLIGIEKRMTDELLPYLR